MGLGTNKFRITKVPLNRGSTVLLFSSILLIMYFGDACLLRLVMCVLFLVHARVKDVVFIMNSLSDVGAHTPILGVRTRTSHDE